MDSRIFFVPKRLQNFFDEEKKDGDDRKTFYQLLNDLDDKQKELIIALGRSEQGLTIIRANRLERLIEWADIVHPQHSQVMDRLSKWVNEEKGRSSKDKNDWAFDAHLKLIRGFYWLFDEKKDDGWTYAPVFDEVFRLYLKFIKRDDTKKELERLMGKIDFAKGRQHVIGRMKELTAMAKTGQERFRDDWKYFVDLDQMCGFNISGEKMSDVEKVEEKIRHWGEDKVADRNLVVKDYDKKLLKEMKTLVNESTPNMKYYPKLSEWLENPENWVTSGSSQGVYTEVRSPEGNIVKSANVKAAIATELEKERVQEILCDPTVILPAKVAIKVELGGRNRLIVGMDWVMNARLGYVLDWFARNIVDVEYTPVYNRVDEKLKWLIRRCGETQTMISLPIDDSDYDQEISRGEMDAFIESIDYAIRLMSPKNCTQDLLLMWRLAKDQLWETPVEYGDKVILKRWAKGMPSGIKYTNLGDTFINVARQRLVAGEMKEKMNLKVDIKRMRGFGDDADQQHKNWLTLLVMLCAFEDLGYKPHKAKNFASLKCTEWLRKIISKEGEVGYPGRSISKLIFRDPMSAITILSRNELNSMAEQFSVTFGRMDNNEVVIKEFVNEVHDRLRYRGFDVTKEVVKNLITTPRSIGGLGFAPRIGTGGMFGLVQELERLDTDNEIDKLARKSWYFQKDLGSYKKVVENTKKLLTKEEGERMTDTSLRRQLGNELAPKGFSRDYDWVLKIDEEEEIPVLNIGSYETSGTLYVDYRVDERYNFINFELLISNITNRKVCTAERAIEIVRTIASPKARGLMEILLRKATGKVFWLWVRGKWPTATPIVPGCNLELVNFVSTLSKKKYYSHMISSYNKFGYDKIKVYSCNAENYCFRKCNEILRQIKLKT